MLPIDELLHTTFGYSAFRPHQREIIQAYLADRDVLAILPTGGGKSLCFQLPALVRPGLTLVVSPLIALMKDQVDQLEAAGVAATFVNSSLDGGEFSRRMRGLSEGRFRLLYAAPERLVLDNWRGNLDQWNVQAMAIDEAHCISEWGHDFRPEYRQLQSLRDQFPAIPIMALTATATARVRQDIAHHLNLRDPAQFVASFDRPNLSYRVIAKERPHAQILEFLRHRPRDAGIVYCASRASAEKLADALQEAGIPARPYHAGLDADTRSRNQELFVRDEIRAICATIAFGMGINKPNVRWIIHHDLPRHLEGYYQETGRAGRDGLPADCLLLYRNADAVKQLRFINEIEDQQERDAARRRLNLVQQFAESSACRRQTLLAYFGEAYHATPCPACDNCLEPRESIDATIAAQKLLSCVFRIREQSGFAVGLNHVVEVLLGANTERIRKWDHQRLSTYGIGKERVRAEWLAIGRELLQRGFLSTDTGRLPILSLTQQGLDALLSREPIFLTRPLVPHQKPGETSDAPARSASQRAGAIECDEQLFERLRTLRRQLADERNVPAYIILGDVSLRQMARDCPVSLSAMRLITGVGDKKLADFGQLFVDTIRAYLDKQARGA